MAMDDVKTVVFGDDGRELSVVINRRDRVVTISENIDGEEGDGLCITTASFSELASIFLLCYENRNLDMPIIA